jgi:tetratricopeptide (TPR) repeat protein
MRALIGPLNREGHGPVTAPMQDLDARCFDRTGADISFDPAVEPLEALWKRLPAGWTPDCMIWWSPEYSILPEGIERSPVPSIAVLGDWNLGLWTTAPLLEAFDWVVTDRLGVRELGPQLEVPVDYWPVFSFDPELHRERPGQERDLDLVFVGNFNHEVQAERAPWLARLASLSDRHRVLLTSGLYGEAYADLLRRARIVWNRGIRGELNMRAYEAAACGALLFMEEENLEVRDLFVDGESCVLYGTSTLERLVDEYLARPELIARLAAAGRRTVERETYGNHLQRLLRDAARLRRGQRTFGRLPAWRRDYWLAIHALCSADPGRLRAALAHLVRALSRAEDHTTVAAGLGAVALMAAGETTDAAERPAAFRNAGVLLDAALAGHPGDAVSRMNRGWLLLCQGDVEGARREIREAQAVVAGHAEIPVDRVPIPLPFDRFRVEWERAAIVPDVQGRARRFGRLLDAHLSAMLARLEGDCHTRLAWWQSSVAAGAGIADNVRSLAEAQEQAGQLEAAAAAYRRALATNPFDWAARRQAVALARRTGDESTVRLLQDESRRLACAAPIYADQARSVQTLPGTTESLATFISSQR